MTTRKYFGTDGVRGKVGEFPITPDFVLKLGWAAGRVLAQHSGNGGRGKVLIGKDTRISGYMFESALQAGLSAAGLDIELTGPLPTPAIAYLTRTMRAQAGIVISASHNPYHDNGIKFFSAEGTKLADEIELAIEAELDREIATVDSAQLGKARRIVDAEGRYIEFCKSTVPAGMSLKGIKLVLDCANGAAYHVAPSALRELGAEVITLGSAPDGLNINENCGSTSPQLLIDTVIAEKADLGIALDGDADRVMMVDHKGELVDGDEILFIIASEKVAMGQGAYMGGVVGTVMSNFGLEQALQRLNIPFKRAAVGDRYVMELLAENNWMLGGESSGHIICRDRVSTGDGTVSALQVLAAMVRSDRSLNELKKQMQKMPQTLINVPIAGKVDINQNPSIKQAVDAAEAKLADTGRVLLRPSGTEPLIRVMVEGENAEQILQLAQELADVVGTAAS
jgi:phosphoglucosamine mutase